MTAILELPEIRNKQPKPPAASGSILVLKENAKVHWRTIRQDLLSGRYDLIHAHGLSAAASAVIANIGLDVPLVVTVCDPLRESEFLDLRASARRWLLGRALMRADAIIALSDDARDNLLRTFPNLRRHAERVVTIPPGIDVDAEAPEPSGNLRDELQLAEDVTLVGYIGRFAAETGFPLLLEAVARLVKYGGVSKFHVIAFGSGDDQPARRHVTIRPMVAHVGEILPQLDLLVVPSLYEASSVVAMEAMAAGVPVLGSRCPGLRQVLHDTPSRTVQPGCAASLEAGLREALYAPWTEEARDFAQAARTRFDKTDSVQRLTELYQRIFCSSSGEEAVPQAVNNQ